MNNSTVGEHGWFQCEKRDCYYCYSSPKQVACKQKNHNSQHARQHDHHRACPERDRLKLTAIVGPKVLMKAPGNFSIIVICITRRLERLFWLNKKQRQCSPHLY